MRKFTADERGKKTARRDVRRDPKRKKCLYKTWGNRREGDKERPTEMEHEPSTIRRGSSGNLFPGTTVGGPD